MVVITQHSLEAQLHELEQSGLWVAFPQLKGRGKAFCLAHFQSLKNIGEVKEVNKEDDLKTRRRNTLHSGINYFHLCNATSLRQTQNVLSYYVVHSIATKAMSITASSNQRSYHLRTCGSTLVDSVMPLMGNVPLKVSLVETWPGWHAQDKQIKMRLRGGYLLISLT